MFVKGEFLLIFFVLFCSICTIYYYFLISTPGQFIFILVLYHENKKTISYYIYYCAYLDHNHSFIRNPGKEINRKVPGKQIQRLPLSRHLFYFTAQTVSRHTPDSPLRIFSAFSPDVKITITAVSFPAFRISSRSASTSMSPFFTF